MQLVLTHRSRGTDLPFLSGYASGWHTHLAQLVALLDALGVASHPAAYGIDAPEWARIVDHAFDGARGRNFIGTRARFPHFDFSPEQPERALH